MIAGIYSDLPPSNEKMSRLQIKVQVAQNSAMRIRMTYARLVMVYYYAHMPSKASQWAAIDDRLRVLRTSSKRFQQAHAQLVLDKDDELFSHGRDYKSFRKEELVLPTLDDVKASLASSSSTQ
ncbi:hypothetical protein PGT21_018426 [Puccinia graminis f. sp. tritici]|uniref:Uncharacterized protein n=1 Tax=Puccinia graminis f. sp. tritici TaxID=56615 RepID=A0A5B0P1Q4_PUCGR|nr:hypothetical protein PGT21_018426 [Puccinia graminis f. sp. tritici]